MKVGIYFNRYIKEFIFHFVFQMMDAIKGTMTEIYNDLSKNTTGSTIAEVSVRLKTNIACIVTKSCKKYFSI